MKNTLVVFLLLSLIMVFAQSCNKCYECNQYCAYCEAANGVRLKACSTKSVNQYQVDSTLAAFRAAGYNCTLLNEFKNVCDQPSKINSAINYYYNQDYYCNEKQ